MKIPTLYYGDEDSVHISVVSIRKLHVAVLIRAILDLYTAENLVRDHAIDWFNGAPARITFKEVRETLDLSAHRLEKIKKCIAGEVTAKKIRNKVSTLVRKH